MSIRNAFIAPRSAKDQIRLLVILIKNSVPHRNCHLPDGYTGPWTTSQGPCTCGVVELNRAIRELGHMALDATRDAETREHDVRRLLEFVRSHCAEGVTHV